MATLRGRPVDRPAVSFYEIGGFAIDPADGDPFNIYNDPSWRPLLQLAEERTDLIRMRGPRLTPAADNCGEEFFTTETWTEGPRRFTRTTLRIAGRTMTSLARRDAEVDTVWTVEHLLKDADDVEAYLQLPQEVFRHDVDVSDLIAADEQIGQDGIVMVDVGDPICHAAPLLSMADYTVLAMTEPALFHRLLEKLSREIHRRTEQVAREFPAHLWRICGSEYASEPYLPPRLYEEYVVRYTAPMVQAIERHGGFARIHSHGRLRAILPHIAGMGASGLDPVEPPPQGDMELSEIRRGYGRQLVLFGNIEVSEIENLPPAQFERRAAQALRDGTAGEGRGFVLMPSAAPYGRKVTPRTMANYETMVRLVESFGG